MDQRTADYACEYPGCSKIFSSAIGKGVHQQRMHKDWYDSRLQPAVKKTRWSAEEAAMLARREVELIRATNPRFMNQELLNSFPLRSLEAIKGRRRRAEHKNLVQRFLEEPQDEDDIAPYDDQELGDDGFLDYLEALPRITDNQYEAERLSDIVRAARSIGKEATIARVALYLRDIFPQGRSVTWRHKLVNNVAPRTKREARRREYAVTQTMWKKNRSRCITNILDHLGDTRVPGKEVMEPFWRAVMTADSAAAPPISEIATVDGIWTPITPRDLKIARVPLSSASGPDGVTARQLRAVPSSVLLRLFNLFMWCGGLPEDLLRSRTVFLPKKRDASLPGDFRPITIPSVIVRSLHRILAKRLETTLDIDARQRAFRATDGCADNIFLLDTMLRYHRASYKSLYMASLDVSKAFDSVSHQAVWATLENMGVPRSMVKYLTNVYAGSATRLEGDGWVSKLIHPTRGVRQGDPMSPIVFNSITHMMLRQLPSEVGARLGGDPINAAAFADDLLLFASTADGLQQLINRVADYLADCGMSINVEKSMTVAVVASPRYKKTAVNPSVSFKCGPHALPTTTRTSSWRYLGVYFTPEGRIRSHPSRVISPLLELLTRAPLKPQQRVFALKSAVIPRLYHQLALGAVTIGALNKVDRIVRAALRNWLRLPHDTPVAYLHASARDGGLGIPSMRWMAPLLRRGRLLAALGDLDRPDLRGFGERELSQCGRRLNDHGHALTSSEMIRARWRNRLYAAVDGGALKEASDVHQQNQWVSDGTRLLSGKDYINCVRLRIGALPTRSRTTRGRYEERRCRAGCLAQETLNHVLQQCHRTHAARIKRHDAVVAYLARNMPRGGYRVFSEPRYVTPSGIRKPDLVAVLGHTAIVVDAQVVGEQADLNAAHRKKAQYYSEPGTLGAIRTEHNVDTVVVTSATLSCRGIWSSESAAKLGDLGFLRTTDYKVLSTRVLIGGLAAFRIFNATTSVICRTGIG